MAIDMSPLIGGDESQRQQQIHDKLERACRAQRRTRLLQRIFSSIRGFSIFLMAAVVVTLIVWHWNEINSVAAQKISHVVATVQIRDDSPLRQGALNYEKEVEAAAGN
jgi:hypothetical protein